jgi:RimJ/RimL family protein N-acetyltransferase
MLERFTTQAQVDAIYDHFSEEENWFWWIEGAYPDYGKFEDWIRGCQNDDIGIFVNKFKRSTGVHTLLGFTRFSNTNLMHGFTYLTVWLLPSLRTQRGLMPYGLVAAAEAINFAFYHYPIRKIYQHVVKANTGSLSSTQKAAQTEGVLKAHYFFEGEYHDLVILSIDRETWQQFYERYKKRIAQYF